MKFLTPSLLVLLCFILGGFVFKLTTPHNCDTIAPDDSIFVLTGDKRRIPFALAQCQKYPDSDLYIIGTGAEVALNFPHAMRIEPKSKSTYQNALAIRDIVSRAGLDRIVVITTEDHMKRAAYLIRDELPGTEIVTCAAPLTGMPSTKRLERWTVEYIKYIVTKLGIKEG